MLKNSHWLWIALLTLAVLLRVGALGQAPLGPDEAQNALDALDAAQGGGWPRSTESPLLLVGNTLLFALLGSSNVMARVIPALAGIALVALPYLWRERLSDVGTLTAAGLLLLSPLSLLAARALDSATLGVLGAGLLLAALTMEGQSAPGDTHKIQRFLVIAGVGIGLIGGPAFYTTLIAGGAAWLVHGWITSQQQGANVLEKTRARLQTWGRPALMGLGLALLIATGFGLRWNGWSGLADGFAAWLAAWRGPSGTPSTLLLLLLYEPVTLVFAALGLVQSLRRTEPYPMTLALWALIAMLLTELQPGSDPASALAAVIPLALLAGYGVQSIVEGVSARVAPWIAGHTLIGVIFWIPAVLAVAGHARNIPFGGPPVLLIIGAAALLSLHVLIGFMFGVFAPPAMVWRGALLSIVAVLLLCQTSFAWGLGFLRRTDPLEPALPVVSSPDLETLPQLLDDLITRAGRRRDTFSIALVAQDPAVTAVTRWVLRDFPGVSVRTGWPTDGADAVISPTSLAGDPVQAQVWQGMSFIALTHGPDTIPACAQLLPPECSALAGWYLYRQPFVEPDVTQVVLWVQP